MENNVGHHDCMRLLVDRLLVLIGESGRNASNYFLSSCYDHSDLYDDRLHDSRPDDACYDYMRSMLYWMSFSRNITRKLINYIYMPGIERVSSATMHNLGAYESTRERLDRILRNPGFSLSRMRRRTSKRSLPTSLERRMPGAEHYDGFNMKRRKARGKRKTQRRKKTRRHNRNKRRNTRR